MIGDLFQRVSRDNFWCFVRQACIRFKFSAEKQKGLFLKVLFHLLFSWYEEAAVM